MAIRNFYIEILSRHGKEPAKWPKVLQLFEYITENTEGVVSHIYSGNMPEWAVNDLPLFFECMEGDERRNATMCRHVSGPIPRELNTDQGIALVKKFMAKITDKYKLPFVVAFHDLQTHAPHYHGLISERSTLDAIPREPKLFFRRANSTHPEKGGAPKATIANKEWKWVSRTIDIWTEFANAALEAVGSSERIDRRTLIEKRANRIALPYLKESVLQMEERGVKTKVMDIYIGIEEMNNNAQDIEQIMKRCEYKDGANELKLAKKKSQLVEESANLPAKGIEKNAERFIREIKEFIEERNKEMEKYIEAINCKMIKNKKIAEEMKLIYLEIEDKSENGSKKKIYLFGRKRQTAYEIMKENLENYIKQLNERKEERAEYYSRELTRCRLGICIYKQLAEEIQANQYEQTEETEVKQLDTVRKTEQKENQKIPEVMVIKVENFPGINEFIKILRERTPHFIESNGKIIESYPNELDKNDYYLAEDGTAKLKNAEQKGVDRHDTKQVATTKKNDYLVNEAAIAKEVKKKKAKEKARQEAEEEAKREAEEKARQEAEEHQREQERLAEERRKAEEEAKREAEEKARQEAEEHQREQERLAEERRKAEEEAKREAEAEEKARQEAEEHQREQERLAEERRKAEEEAKREAEEKARQEAEEHQREQERLAEERRKAEEEAKREAEEEAKREAEEKARQEAEEHQREQERLAEERRKAEEEAKREAEEKARQEAEEHQREQERLAEERRKAEEEARKLQIFDPPDPELEAVRESYGWPYISLDKGKFVKSFGDIDPDILAKYLPKAEPEDLGSPPEGKDRSGKDGPDEDGPGKGGSGKSKGKSGFGFEM